MTDIQQCSIRELSLDEVDSVGGGSFWGRFAHGFKSFAKDVDQGAIVGGVTGAVGGAVAGEGVGAVPGAAAGLAVGAAGGAATWLTDELGL